MDAQKTKPAMRKYGISEIIDQRMREIRILSQKMRDLISKAGEKTSSEERERLLSFEAAIADCKRRAEELENENYDLLKINTELVQKIEQEREKSANEIKELTKDIFKLSDENSNLNATIDLQKQELHALQKQKKLLVDEKIRSELHESLILHSDYQNLQDELVVSTNEARLLRIENNDLLKKLESLTFNCESHSQEIEALKIRLSEKVVSFNKLKSDNAMLKEQIRQLQGKITVICRIKPHTNKELVNIHEITATEEAVTVDKSIFLFDNVLLPFSDQKTVYNQFSSMIESLIHGYNVCVLAYGQTGSGKTYTMEGTSENPGLIPAALSAIYAQKESFKTENIHLSLNAGVFEIYNETIVDLLDNSNKKCEIKHTENRTTISNCVLQELQTFEDAMELLKIATKNRSVGATQCNIRSSRSHLIFRLDIVYTDPQKKETRTGTLNLIDLAGSERLNESKAEGVRLKETTNINLSLTALGNVINAVAQNSPHVPYRSSKLTYYLQNYFSGKGFIALIVNISSEFKHANETICSLRFAEKVKRCTLGKQTKNIKVGIS